MLPNVFDHLRGGHHDAIETVAQGARTKAQLHLADLGDHGGDLFRRHTHLHLTDQGVDAAGFTGKSDTHELAHRAAATVAPHDVPGTHLRTVGQRHADAVVVLREADRLTAPSQYRTARDRVFDQDAVGDGLRYAQHVRVRRVERPRRRLRDPREVPTHGMPTSDFQEAVQKSTLVHDFDASGM